MRCDGDPAMSRGSPPRALSTRRKPERSLVGAGLVLFAACGLDSLAPPPISVSVVPPTASLLTSASQDFMATVANDPSNSGVTWSITECTGGSGVCGSLSNVTSTTATYTAPATVPPSGLGITATAVADNTKSFTASVTITAISASGQIAFISDRDGNLDIYLMNADGSGVMQLTNDPSNDTYPDWSPDGTRIAFTSFRDGNWEIYVMNADGSHATRLTDNGAQWPAWSPDGTRIAFNTVRDGNWEIYVMNADGSDPRNLTNSPDEDGSPAWSPDGTKIAFNSHRDGNEEIYVMNADGSGLGNLTNNPAADGGAAWRPQAVSLTGPNRLHEVPRRQLVCFLCGAAAGGRHCKHEPAPRLSIAEPSRRFEPTRSRDGVIPADPKRSTTTATL